MRFYKVINNKTKEVCLTAQINETTLGGINYKDQPLSSIEQLLELAGDNFTDLDNIALPLLNSTKFKINLEDLISSSKEKSGLFRMCQPYTPTEIWAAGVTYKSSELERKRESDTPDVYAKVYNSDRPEIFFKATKVQKYNYICISNSLKNQERLFKLFQLFSNQKLFCAPI